MHLSVYQFALSQDSCTYGTVHFDFAPTQSNMLFIEYYT